MALPRSADILRSVGELHLPFMCIYGLGPRPRRRRLLGILCLTMASAQSAPGRRFIARETRRRRRGSRFPARRFIVHLHLASSRLCAQERASEVQGPAGLLFSGAWLRKLPALWADETAAQWVQLLAGINGPLALL